MNSTLYIGQVMHGRLRPVRHSFRYPVYFYGIDVDELPALDRAIPLFGYNRVRLVSLHDADYLQPGPEPIREKVTSCLARHGVTAPIGRIVLITAARFLNYVFNPVSFFYCYRPDDSLAAIIAFVNNTFHEAHLYVLHEPCAPRTGYDVHYQATKQFHVSPFFDISGHYDFFFTHPTDKLEATLRLVREENVNFVARVRCTARPLTTGALARTVLAYPLTAVLTMPRILWQAARLHYQRKLPVYPKPPPRSPDTVRTAPVTRAQRLATRAVFGRFNTLRGGTLRCTLPDQSVHEFGDAACDTPFDLQVTHHRFFVRLATAGGTGLGEAYMADEWRSSDLTGLLTFLARNRDALCSRHRFLELPKRAIHRLGHLARANTRAGSRTNIGEHYDLGNEFFRLFLDPSLTYSCALYDHPGQSLQAAQENKLKAILRQGEIGPEHRVLEIGCGWGSFAISATRETGCRVTAVTVSANQHRLTRERVKQAGLEDRIDVQLCDYRDLQGQFDRIVSIEMLEAVGHRFLGEYFRNVDRVLAPGGRVVLQVITIPDQRYEQYRRTTDWINRHIFPGGHLPSLTALCQAATRESQLLVDQVTNIGDHYAPTLAAWRREFLKRRDEVKALGFDEAFVRKWEFYFSYCEAGFAARILNDLHIVMRRAGE